MDNPDPEAARAPSDHLSGLSRTYYLLVGGLALLFASLPYLIAWAQTPPHHVFSGLIPNIDDSCVYLTWMRYAARGHFFQRNLFSVEPQGGLLFNLYFWALGNISRFVPGIAVFHAARVLGGAALLASSVTFLRLTLAHERARRLAFALICFGAGFGWIFGGFDPERGWQQSIDLYQTEAFPFQSLYFGPLFAPMTALIVTFVNALLRSERTNRLLDTWPAMAAGAILGNAHTYDIVPLFVVAFVWRLSGDIAAKRVNWAGWTRLIAVGIASLPTTLLVAYAMKKDPLFAARAAVPTPTPAPWWLICGFGVPLLLAAIALWRRDRDAYVSTAAWRWLAVGVIVGILLGYLPLSFQRKLLMGVSFPMFALAGVALDRLTMRLPGSLPRLAALAAILITMPSNLLVLAIDHDRLAENASATSMRPYLSDDEMAALLWLREHGGPDDNVLIAPDPSSHRRYPFSPLAPHLAPYVPAFAGVTAYNGHWGETLDYGYKYSHARRFFQANVDDDYRKMLLDEGRIRYVLYLNALGQGPLVDATGAVMIDPKTQQPTYTPVSWPERNVPSFLKPTFANAEITVYEVH